MTDLNAMLEDHWNNWYFPQDLDAVVARVIARLQNGEPTPNIEAKLSCVLFNRTRLAIDILSFLHPLTVVDLKLIVLPVGSPFGGRGKLTYGRRKLTFTCTLHESSHTPGIVSTDNKYLFTWFRRVHDTFARVNVEIEQRGVRLDLPDWLKSKMSVPTLQELTRYWFVKRGFDHRKPVVDNWEHYVPRINYPTVEEDSDDDELRINALYSQRDLWGKKK